MSEIELLEKIIAFVDKKKNAKIQANEIIEKYGKLSNVLREDIFVLEGLNLFSKKTLKLLEILNLTYRHVFFSDCFEEEKKISCFEDLINYLKFEYINMEREIFKVLYFNSKNILIKDENIFLGTVDRSVVHVREILKNILKYNAKSIIVVHNHPSGVVNPSLDDFELTKKLLDILNFVDVRLSDHIIISNKGYYSFLENNKI